MHCLLFLIFDLRSLSNFIQHPTQKVRIEDLSKRYGSILICYHLFILNLLAPFHFLIYDVLQMDYGAFNKLIGREVDQPFWGTRTEHIVGVAACLAVTDHASQKVFSSYLGRELCFAKVNFYHTKASTQLRVFAIF